MNSKCYLILLIIIFIIIIFIFKKEHFKDHECVSTIKEDSFKNILSYWNLFSKEHNIKYSIFFGTLLGYKRDKEFIGWDGDMDAIIDTNANKKLNDLAKDPNEKRVIFTKDLKKDLSYNNYKWKPNEIKILVKYKDYYVKCDGNKVNTYTDSCSLGMPKWGGDKLCGRVILNDINNYKYHLDLFYDYKKEKYGKFYDKVFSNLKETELEKCSVKVPNTNIIEDSLKEAYGANWNVPIKICDKKNGKWINNPNYKK
jgi:hypothetical protein